MPNYVNSNLHPNFFYTRGETPVYNKSSFNSLIISDSEEGAVYGINDHAVIKNHGQANIIPIANFREVIGASEEILNHARIIYEKPTSIYDRENLEHLNLQRLKGTVSNAYGLNITELDEIKNKKGQYRIYKVVSKEGEFILKHRGKNKERFQAQAHFIKNSVYFPEIIQTINGSCYIILNENIYALEEFVGGTISKGNPSEYFGMVGEYLALFHNEINSKSEEKLEKILTNKKHFLSESNLISTEIDLRHNYADNKELLDEIISLSEKYLRGKFNLLPDCIIHGDLNKSNIIWDGTGIKIIDCENIEYSKRIKDFIPALLFGGNFHSPFYKQNSADQLMNQYNLYADKKLTQLEKDLLPEMLKIHSIKAYVIYNIRRNGNNEEFKKEMIRNIRRIKKEFK